MISSTFELRNCAMEGPGVMGSIGGRNNSMHTCLSALLTAGKLRALIRRVLGWPNVVVVTSYEGMKSLKALLLPCNWDYCILDEGQRIRNPDAAVMLSASSTLLTVLLNR